MHTLESLERKIKTSRDLLSVVKTMKSLAAVNIRQYERAVESLEEYCRVIDMAWQVLFRYELPVQGKGKGKRAVCLVMGSDQGMCGQFNEALISFALEKTGHMVAEGMAVDFWGAGEKVIGALADEAFECREQFHLPGSVSGINTQVQMIVQRIEDWLHSQGIERFYLCHNQISGAGGYDQALTPLLPLDREWAQSYAQLEWPGRCLPFRALPHRDMFSHLFRQHLFVSIYRAFAQSLAGENAARLMAMQAAEKNIIEMQEDLTALFREKRQAAITDELLDIVSGFEALSKKGETI